MSHRFGLKRVKSLLAVGRRPPMPFRLATARIQGLQNVRLSEVHIENPSSRMVSNESLHEGIIYEGHRSLQQGEAARLAWLLGAGTGGRGACAGYAATEQLGGLWTIQSVRSSSITYSLEASIEHELTFGLDHLVGADHSETPSCSRICSTQRRRRAGLRSFPVRPPAR